MTELAIAAVIIAGLGVYALRLYLAAVHPPHATIAPPAITEERMRALEERVGTIEIRSMPQKTKPATIWAGGAKG